MIEYIYIYLISKSVETNMGATHFFSITGRKTINKSPFFDFFFLRPFALKDP